jgi:hypothetical protein
MIIMDTKDIEKLQIYNFIDVTHIFHKLFTSLGALISTLALLTYAVGILIWLLFVIFFQVGKKKKIVEMSSYYSRSTKLYFHLPFQ